MLHPVSGFGLTKVILWTFVGFRNNVKLFLWVHLNNCASTGSWYLLASLVYNYSTITFPLLQQMQIVVSSIARRLGDFLLLLSRSNKIDLVIIMLGLGCIHGYMTCLSYQGKTGYNAIYACPYIYLWYRCKTWWASMYGSLLTFLYR